MSAGGTFQAARPDHSDFDHAKLVAFSGKRHGFGPSCGAQRMVQTAAPAVLAMAPTGPVFAISKGALLTRAEVDQVRVAKQALLQTLSHPQCR